MSNLEKLQSRINYEFQQPPLLEQALTHRSYSSANNERLEFLGDSILNFVITQDIYRRFATASEGELSRLRAGLVKQSTLAEIAKDLELGGYLKMGTGELKTGGFQRDSILSDTLEAIFGAILLDGGVEVITPVIESLFAERLEALNPDDLKKDAKSRLQEHLQSLGQNVPEYRLVRTTGKSPNQVFEIHCETDALEEAVVAEGSSKRRAEQSAAKKALKLMGIEK